MNTEKIEQLMLLEQSGELGFIGRWQLRRALKAQPELAKFRDELQSLTRASRSVSLPGSELPANVLGEIRKAAAEQTTHRIPLELVVGSWLRPTIALAAMLVTILGIGVVNHFQHTPSGHLATNKPSVWNDGFDNELNKLDTMIAANFDGADASTLDANALARELLMFEGVNQ